MQAARVSCTGRLPLVKSPPAMNVTGDKACCEHVTQIHVAEMASRLGSGAQRSREVNGELLSPQREGLILVLSLPDLQQNGVGATDSEFQILHRVSVLLLVPDDASR